MATDLEQLGRELLAQRAANAARQRASVARRKASGVCLRCNDLARPGRVHCAPCAAKASQNVIASHRRARGASASASGAADTDTDTD